MPVTCRSCIHWPVNHVYTVGFCSLYSHLVVDNYDGRRCRSHSGAGLAAGRVADEAAAGGPAAARSAALPPSTNRGGKILTENDQLPLKGVI